MSIDHEGNYKEKETTIDSIQECMFEVDFFLREDAQGRKTQ